MIPDRLFFANTEVPGRTDFAADPTLITLIIDPAFRSTGLPKQNRGMENPFSIRGFWSRGKFKLRGFPFLSVDQVYRVALVAGLVLGMGAQVAVVAGFHPRTIRTGRDRVVDDVAVAIDAQDVHLLMLFM